MSGGSMDGGGWWTLWWDTRMQVMLSPTRTAITGFTTFQPERQAILGDMYQIGYHVHCLLRSFDIYG